MAGDKAPRSSEDDLCGLEGAQPGEGLLVDDPVAAGFDGEEPGVVRRRQRADEGKRSAVEQLVVVVGVLPGVVDQGEAGALAVRVRDPSAPKRAASSLTIDANWVTSGRLPG